MAAVEEAPAVIQQATSDQPEQQAAAATTAQPEKQENKQEQDDSNFPIADIDETAKYIDELEDGAEKLSIEVENHSGDSITE